MELPSLSENRLGSILGMHYCTYFCLGSLEAYSLFVWPWLIVNDRKFSVRIVFFSHTNQPVVLFLWTSNDTNQPMYVFEDRKRKLWLLWYSSRSTSFYISLMVPFVMSISLYILEAASQTMLRKPWRNQLPLFLDKEESSMTCKVSNDAAYKMMNDLFPGRCTRF